MTPGVIGRDAELAALQAFLDAMASGPTAFVLRGEPGIGKTALWEAGIAAARGRGFEVLVARPSQAEAQLSFAALNDLLEGVDDATLGTLPAPQRRALEIALLRVEPSGVPPEPRAIAAGFLHVLRTLSARNRVLVAIDDVQWLDAASLEALTFAARRLEGEAVRFLVAERLGGPSALTRALDNASLERVDVSPLSLGAGRHLLAERLGLVMPRRTMRRIYETTQGNPLFILEVGRILVDRGISAIEGNLPLPGGVEESFGLRIRQMPTPVRRVLLAVALSADLRMSALAEIAEQSAIDDARDSGLLELDGSRWRASHPLLAEAVLTHARARERNALHLELARVAGDEGVRARHLALAATGLDDTLAATLSAAAAAASARGARADAVELAELALRLTPPTSAFRSDRLLALGESLDLAGELRRLQALLRPEVEGLPQGRVRARALLLLLNGETNDEASHQLIEQALVESVGDPATRSRALAAKAMDMTGFHIERLRQAEGWALEALSMGIDAVETRIAVGWVRILRGCPVDDLVELERASSVTTPEVFYSLDRLAGIRFAFRGDVAAARATFTRLLSLADERGEAWSYDTAHLQLSEVELRAGEIDAARPLIDESQSWLQEGTQVVIHLPRCRALLAVTMGLHLEALAWAGKAMRLAQERGSTWDLLETRRARGIALLLMADPVAAAEDLRAVWDHTQREGVDDPGAFPAAPDLVEVLVTLGEIDQATAVTDRLEGLALDQEHPWGLATAKRCRAMVRLASDPADAEAFATLSEAASAYGELGLRFDHARSLLILGRGQRRARRWGDARRSLERALASFEGMGAPGWADQAHSELDRVGARRPAAAGTLTAAEDRVVELAAEGRSNKEIAHTLSIGVHTVEVQLSRAYAKLGVQSRAQLARRLADGPTP